MSDRATGLSAFWARAARVAQPRRGQPPSPQVSLWNRIAVAFGQALSLRESRQLVGLEQALARARQETAVPDDLTRLGLPLNRGLGGGGITPEVSAALARLVVTLESRSGWGCQNAGAPAIGRDLQYAWRLLNGGVLLSVRPAGLWQAFDIACLAGAMAGRYVLVVTDSHEAAERVGERLASSAAALGHRLTIVPQGTGRAERRLCYQADIVCVEASTLAIDLLHDQQQSGPQHSLLRRRLTRLRDTSHGAATALQRMLPERPALGLCLDAGAVLGERALENHALWATSSCHDESSLAEQALELADTLREGDHFTLAATSEPPCLTQAGSLALDAMAQRRGGLLINPWLREAAVSRALLVRHRVEEGQDFTLTPEGHVLLRDPVLEAMEASATPPGIRTLIACAAGKGLPGRGVAAQARNQQLLAGGIESLGGVGLALPGIAGELAALHDLRVWHVDRMASPPRRPELYEAGDAGQLAALMEEWRLAEAMTPGWIMPAASLEALDIEPGEPHLALERLLEVARHGHAPAGLTGVSHLLLVLDESHDPDWFIGLLHARLSGLEACRVVVLRPGLRKCRRLAAVPLGRRYAAWRHRRFLGRRRRLKRRVLKRDEALYRLTQFHGDGGR